MRIRESITSAISRSAWPPRAFRAAVSIAFLTGAVACSGWRPPATNSVNVHPVTAASAAETGGSKKVIAGRPAIYALAPGCAPAGSKFQCNPVNNQGCQAERGEACDDDERDGFGCYPAPNTVAAGGACNDEEGPSCRGGLGCDTSGADDGDDDKEEVDGICRPYCCSNADCASKKCVVIEKSNGTLGFCS